MSEVKGWDWSLTGESRTGCLSVFLVVTVKSGLLQRDGVIVIDRTGLLLGPFNFYRKASYSSGFVSRGLLRPFKCTGVRDSWTVGLVGLP